jgi:hypothetical protein
MSGGSFLRHEEEKDLIKCLGVGLLAREGVTDAVMQCNSLR